LVLFKSNQIESFAINQAWLINNDKTKYDQNRSNKIIKP